jgi:predicted aspartyl protease
MYAHAPLVTLLLACLALAGCQGDGADAPCQMVHVTDMRLIRRPYSFYTTISINGQDANLMFDTGSEFNLLTDGAAKRLGLEKTYATLRRAEGVGGVAEIGAVRSKNVGIGAAHGADLTFSTASAETLVGDADGILGMNFLYNFDIDLDFWGNRIGLYKPLSGCRAPRTAMAEPLYVVPLVPQPFGAFGLQALRPAIFVTINGTRLRAVIDTGAQHSAIFRDSAHRAGVGEAALVAQSIARGVGPRLVQADVRISPPVVVGDLTITNMPIRVLDQRHMDDADMLLGYDFVTRVHVWISRSSDSVILQYPPAATPLTDLAK